MLHIQDIILREVSLPAAPEEVWKRSFGSGEALSSWFPERVEGEYGPGGTFCLIWGEHRSEARIAEWNPPHSLAYQWHPGDAYALDAMPESELTTVRFELLPQEGGTLVRMTESGFANIAESRAIKAFEANNGGWDEELAKLPKGY